VDVQVLDEEQDAGSGVGSADADGVEPAAVAEGDLAGLVDAFGADPVVGVAAAVAGSGFRAGGIRGGRGGLVRQGAVRPRLGGWLGGQPLLERLLERLRLAASGGVIWPGVLLGRGRLNAFDPFLTIFDVPPLRSPAAAESTGTS
jgi:hypothetical protein